MTPTEGPSDESGGLLLRPATPDDVRALAAVHRTARAASPMPPSPHPASDLEPWLARRLAAGDETWVAEVAGEVVGYARLGTGAEAWLDDLYVAPPHAAQGIGSALLDLVKSRRPDGFSLWVFEVNEPARRFYARHGLVEVERTDGSDNAERAPDLRLTWRPPGSGAAIRDCRRRLPPSGPDAG